MSSDRVNRTSLLVYIWILALAAVIVTGGTCLAGAVSTAAPITLTVVTQMTNPDDTDGVVLSRFTPEADPGNILWALTWTADDSGWWPTWQLQLHSGVGFLPEGFPRQASTQSWLGSECVTIGQPQPTDGHTYEATVSYDPSTGALSVRIVDTTVTSTIYAHGFALPPHGGAVSALVDDLSADGTKHIPTRVLGISDRYVPLGTEWHVGVQEADGTFLSVSFLGREQKGAVVRLRVPGQSPPGTYTLLLDSDQTEVELARLSPAQQETMLSLQVSELPMGRSKLILRYSDRGEILLESQQEIVVGDLVATFDRVTARPDDPLLAASLRLQSQDTLSDLQVRVQGTIFSVEWDAAQREYKEILCQKSLDLFAGTVAVPAGTPVLVPLGVARPEQSGMWRIVYSVEIAPDVRTTVVGNDQLFTTYQAARIQPQEPYTVAILPDTQVYAQKYPDIFTRQTQWLGEQALALNIGLVLHMGDITETNTREQWRNAARSLHLLDGVVPYVLAVGTHDFIGPAGASSRDNTLMNNYFSIEDAQLYSGLAGVYKPGRIEDSYSLFTLGSDKYLVVSLNSGPSDGAVAWANEIVSRYPDHTVIFITHIYLWKDGSLITPQNSDIAPEAYGYSRSPGESVNNGQQLWEKFVSKHPNMLMVWCGHVGVGAVTRRVDVGEHGNRVYSMMADCQSFAEGGSGWLVLMTFDPDRTVHVRMYSPYLGEYKTDGDRFGYSSAFTIDLNWQVGGEREQPPLKPG